MPPNVGTKAGKGTSSSFPTYAWGVAITLMLALIGMSLHPPMAWSFPVVVAAVLAWPRFQSWRTGTFVTLLVLWGLALVPGTPLHDFVWPCSLGAFTILAAETARGEGVGAPVARFLRSARVQGWVTLTLFIPVGLFGVLAVDRELQSPDVPFAWRWSLLGLVSLMLIPLGRSGNIFRILPAVLLSGIAFLNSVAALPKTASTEIATAKHLYEAASRAMSCLMVAVFVHEGWSKLRPQRTSPAGPGGGPIRVHSGVGTP